MLAAFLTIAVAQERACDPVPVDTLEDRLLAAEGALNSMDLGAAEPKLDSAAEAARCLAVPIPRPLLARLAWGRAELHAARMDEEVAWTWIRLGRESGVSEVPDRVVETHPLRRVYEEDRDDDLPMSGPTGVGLHMPKKGALYADGTEITEPLLRVSTPHLLQVFDKDGKPYLGSWQEGAVFPSSMLVPLVSEGNRSRPTVEAGDELPPANWKPRKHHTYEAYKEWIRKHPNGPWLQDAKDGIDDLDWAATVEKGTELAMREYIHAHSNGLHVDEARFFIEDARYRQVVAEHTREAWLAFLEEYPDGSYGAEAQVQIEVLDWEAAREADTAAAYRAFLEAHPNTKNRAQVERLEMESALDEALASGLDKDLHAFLERWPESVLAREARAVLGDAEFLYVTVEVAGEVDDAVKERTAADLRAELEKREIPLEPPSEEAGEPGRITVQLEIVPERQVQRIQADLALDWSDLKRPLNTLHIESKILPSADAGAMFGEMLAANLRPLDRWLPAKPEQDESSADVAEPVETRILK